jgi:glycosyltransferase involved in cell wall biosynthesis
MIDKAAVKAKFKSLRCCVLIPTYNNAATLENVITTTFEYCDEVMVVNDGATDSTPKILEKFPNLIIVTHPKNKGKGMALRNGFRKACELGFEYVITIDSDGQHYPDDFMLFLDKIEEQPGSLIIGARNMTVDNVPGKSTFGNKFSNFWFLVETGIKLPDTQSGYRLYPVQRLKKIWFFTTKFEYEIEVIVKAAWRGIPVIQVPVKVFYAPAEERVSHFRPGKDFTRISFLNTYLVALMLFWRPIMLFRKFNKANIKKVWKEEVLATHESIFKKSLSLAVGLFFGIVPIWGFQLGAAILVAYLLKLNKAIVVLSANISMPLLLPFVLIASLKTGEFFLNKKINLHFDSSLTLDTVKKSLADIYIYFAGATILSLIAAVAGFLLMFIVLKVFKYTPKTQE